MCDPLPSSADAALCATCCCCFVGDVDALRLLQDDLRDDDYETVIAAMHRLNSVAVALGPTRARNELMPLLTEFAEHDNDEAHTVLARQLGDFTDVNSNTRTHRDSYSFVRYSTAFLSSA